MGKLASQIVPRWAPPSGRSEPAAVRTWLLLRMTSPTVPRKRSRVWVCTRTEGGGLGDDLRLELEMDGRGLVELVGDALLVRLVLGAPDEVLAHVALLLTDHYAVYIHEALQSALY